LLNSVQSSDTINAMTAASHSSSPRITPQNEGRTALVEATIVAISESGPGFVHPNELCRELGLSKSLVNFHFGGRDGLVAEALAVSYERYVDGLWAIAESAGPTHFDKLLAWIMGQVEWTIEHPGIAAGLNFPREAGGLTASMDDEVYQRINAAGNRNFRNLNTLVRAAIVENSPVGSEAPDPTTVALDAAITGWVTLGLSVWASGNHLPTQTIGARDFLPLAKAQLEKMLRVFFSN
jgi:AcrR family transcriptional regulator